MKRLLSIIFALICFFSFAILCYAHPGRTDANGGHYNHKTGEYHYHNGNSINETTTESSGIDWEYWEQKAKEKDEEEYQKLLEDYNNRQSSSNSFSEYTKEKHGTQESDIWTVKEKTNENRNNLEQTTSDFTSTSNNQHSFIENFLFAVFFGIVTAYFVVIVLSNIFKNSTTLWWISAIIAFIITVILYMLNKSQ